MAGNKDDTVIIFDVGRSASYQETKNGPTFFEQEKECVQKILLRKLFTKQKDEVSLMLMGTTTTANRLNDELAGYENISEAFPMAPTNWNMLKYLENSIDPPNKSIDGDWLSAIVVAMDYLKSLEAKKTNLKIILLTTFLSDFNNENSAVDGIISGLNALNIEIIVITNNIEYMTNDDNDESVPVFSQRTQKNKNRREAEKYVLNILDKSQGVVCNFKEAIQQLIYFDKKKRRRMPWNCDLQLGNNVAIKIAAFVYIRDEKEIGSWKPRGAKGEKCHYKTEFYHHDELVDPETIADNLIKGYMYGQTPIPYDESEVISYESGSKSLRCIGFVDQSEICEHNLAGTGIWAVAPQKNSTVADKMMAALTAAMRNSNLAMICRYVYSVRARPKMMVLYPNNHNKKYPDHNSLLMYELFYKENYVQVTFPSLQTKKTEPNNDQYEAVDKLIDSMDLMNVGGDATENNNGDRTHGSEAFRKLLNPALQHMYRAIAHRALHPNESVLAADKDLLELLNAPAELQSQSKPNIDKIKELFPLEVIKKSTKAALFKKLQQISATSDGDVANLPLNSHDAAQSHLIEVGTITPAENFLDLLNRGERYPTMATQIQNVIINIVFKSIVLPEEKVLKAIMAYREQAKLLGPHKYNDWITEFKTLLLQRNKEDVFVKLVQMEGFGLITNKESEMSLVTEEEAAAFYMSGLGTTDTNKLVDLEDEENVEDLFENM